MMRSLTVGLADASSPGANPQSAVIVGSQGRHAVVRQSGIGGCVVDKVLGALLSQVEAAFDRSHPESSARLSIHGVHRVGGERVGIGRVDGIAEQQPLGSQAGDTARLGANPDVSLINTDAIHEIAFQGDGALRGPCRKGVGLVVVDVDTTQGAYQQEIVGGDSQTGEEHVGEGSRSAGMMVFGQLLQVRVVAEQAHVGGDPHHVATLQDVGDVMLLQGFQQGGDLFAHQSSAFLHQTVQTTVDAYPRLAVLFDIADGHVEHAPVVGIVVNMIDLSLSIEGDH